MSDILNEAVVVLNEKLEGADFSGTAKFVVEGEGAIFIDGDGAQVSDHDADVTLSADADTFSSILNGETNPTSAFMTGKLTVDGDMGIAMQLASALA
ncbi:SCP2 sterol-binding domain-containing protein [Tateyamaria pelophila]|uniref:SCP2 sterol-binding domain-containing protein n=1 Tax=Tateyamaria pelophila TaxID=328415 RepID=UPI001CC0B873|nr:SCP2 sterol-binding domain-containing protein [Tateyamaria pelophila]